MHSTTIPTNRHLLPDSSGCSHNLNSMPKHEEIESKATRFGVNIKSQILIIHQEISFQQKVIIHEVASSNKHHHITKTSSGITTSCQPSIESEKGRNHYVNHWHTKQEGQEKQDITIAIVHGYNPYTEPEFHDIIPCHTSLHRIKSPTRQQSIIRNQELVHPVRDEITPTQTQIYTEATSIWQFHQHIHLRSNEQAPLPESNPWEYTRLLHNSANPIPINGR